MYRVWTWPLVLMLLFLLILTVDFYDKHKSFRFPDFNITTPNTAQDKTNDLSKSYTVRLPQSFIVCWYSFKRVASTRSISECLSWSINKTMLDWNGTHTYILSFTNLCSYRRIQVNFSLFFALFRAAYCTLRGLETLIFLPVAVS